MATAAEDGTRVPLTALQGLYLTAQRHFSRPALAVLSDAQARYYVDGLRDCAFAQALPDVFRVLTTRTTAPEYFDLLARSLELRRRVDGDAASEAQLRKAQEEVTAQMLAAVHEAEQARLAQLRARAAARKARAKRNGKKKK
jgi:hypothetical protein